MRSSYQQHDANVRGAPRAWRTGAQPRSDPRQQSRVDPEGLELAVPIGISCLLDRRPQTSQSRRETSRTQPLRQETTRPGI
jgi:hypothetical protein